jgi:gliding motility-associated-like protein
MGTDFDMQNIPIGTTTITNILKLEPTKIKAGVYIVRYTAEDSFYNKKAESFMKILIKRPVDIIPSVAFSPNEDNQNDVWNVKNIESFPDVGVRVVNERGELVFETVSVANLPEKGWNGRRKDGKLAGEGAYYYEFYNNQDQSKLNVGSFVIVR